jgi:hypothetical protein
MPTIIRDRQSRAQGEETNSSADHRKRRNRAKGLFERFGRVGEVTSEAGINNARLLDSLYS